MNWIFIFEILYILGIIAVLLRIIYDTQSVTKTLAYLLIVVFLPFVGAFIYFSIGVNYRKNKLYSKKIIQDKQQEETLLERLDVYNKQSVAAAALPDKLTGLAHMIYTSDRSPLTIANDVKILLNGEEKFPEVLEAMRSAKHHIHLEYYIFEDDRTGQEIEKLLVQKHNEGVEVRFIYDDFGSATIRHSLAERLRKHGVAAVPFYKIKLIHLANRLNYRNHRKIIVIDGHTAFIGGINISNAYDNRLQNGGLYWRDTHLKIVGQAAAMLQHIFIADWNYCARKTLVVNDLYFPQVSSVAKQTVQIVSSGPDSARPSIYYAIIKAIQSARREVLLTTPYFIPGETILDALKMAALSGVRVKLLVPGKSDSFIVNAAAKSYYTLLLRAGVEIFLYQKGFVHAKTLVADQELAIVGTANMDYRSFDLNFEVNALVYNKETATELTKIFNNDLQNATQIDMNSWLKRPKHIQLSEKIARLISPML